MMPRLALIAALFLAMGAHAEDAAPASHAPGPIDYHKLMDVFPQKLLDMPRSNCDGDTIAVERFNLPQASATYGQSGENMPHVLVEISDYADFANVKRIADAMAAWRNVKIDKQTGNGFERTLTIAGHPAFET